jgi:uncharacterized integral membrane protein
MVIVGLLLLLVAVLVAIAAISNGSDPAQLNLQLFTVKTNLTGVYVAGALTLLVGVLGLWLMLAGFNRARRRRGRMKELKKQANRDRGAAADRSGATDDADEYFESAPREPNT